MSVYVARIPPECDEKELREIFEGVGPVKSVSLKSSKGDHKTNYAFIDFTNDDDANCAVQYLNNYKLGDYKLLVNVKKKEGSTSTSESSSSGGVGGFKSAVPRFPFKSSGTQGKGGFGNHGFSVIKSPASSIENDSSGSQFTLGGSNLSMSENGWDEEIDSEKKYIGRVVSEVKQMPSEEKVLVIHVEHPAKFWGQPVSKENAKELDFIAAKLAEECKFAKKINNNVLPKKVYGSKFSVDQQWYRCVIEEHLSEMDSPKVKVRYIDYGNYEIVETSSLVELTISLQQQSPCAREYKLGVDPVNNSEDSDQFKQGVEFLQSLLDNQVVSVATGSGNSTVKVTVMSSNKNVENEMNAAGFTVPIAMQKKDKPDIDALSKPLQPLRSPRNITSHPVNGAVAQQQSKEMEDLKMKYASLQSSLKNSELLAERLKAENRILKQNNNTYEESLAKANSKINDISSWIVNTKFMKLMDDVSSLKKLRGDMSVALGCNQVLKDVVASLTENDNSISLRSLSSFTKLLDAESTLSADQEKIRNCSDKDEIAIHVCKRDGSRKDFIDRSNDFLKDIKCLNFESREKELQNLLTIIEETCHTTSNFQACSGSVSEAIETYENWRRIKSENMKEAQVNVDIWSSLLTNTLENFKQNLSIKEDMGENAKKSQNIDDVIENYWNAVTDEIKSIKETSIDEECLTMVSDVTSSIVHSIRQERNDISTLRDKSVDYAKKKSEFEAWITRKPDTLKLKETRAQLKILKSKFRHKQADRRDLEEDSEEDENLKKIEAELKRMRNEMHRLFTEETYLLGQLSQLAETHFPEFNTLYPELGISAYLESSGILHARELEYYDHHFLPLISSAASQPLVFKAQFNQKDCVLKEYSLCSQISKEIFKSRVFSFAKCKHPNIVPLDSLFFDKAGRKAYLQTPFYGNGNLKDFAETRPDPKDLVGIFYALLQAVQALHDNGCVHGGITPSRISIKKDDHELVAMLREPNFSSDEKKQLEELANIYPAMKWKGECLSKELDMLCFGLLMFTAYFPDQSFNADAILDTKENFIYDVIKALLCENVSDRMTVSDAINHPIFKIEHENAKSLPAVLLKTDADPSDSFAIVELNEPNECTESSDDSAAKKENDEKETGLLSKADLGDPETFDDNSDWLAEE